MFEQSFFDLVLINFERLTNVSFWKFGLVLSQVKHPAYVIWRALFSIHDIIIEFVGISSVAQDIIVSDIDYMILPPDRWFKMLQILVTNSLNVKIVSQLKLLSKPLLLVHTMKYFPIRVQLFISTMLSFYLFDQWIQGFRFPTIHTFICLYN